MPFPQKLKVDRLRGRVLDSARIRILRATLFPFVFWISLDGHRFRCSFSKKWTGCGVFDSAEIHPVWGVLFRPYFGSVWTGFRCSFPKSGQVAGCSIRRRFIPSGGSFFVCILDQFGQVSGAVSPKSGQVVGCSIRRGFIPSGVILFGSVRTGFRCSVLKKWTGCEVTGLRCIFPNGVRFGHHGTRSGPGIRSLSFAIKLVTLQSVF